MQSLKDEIKALSEERSQLQQQLEAERLASDGLRGDLARLSKQAKVGHPLLERHRLSPLTCRGTAVPRSHWTRQLRASV
jgi:hypothetical protein